MQEILGRGWATGISLCLYAATIEVSYIGAMFAAVACLFAVAGFFFDDDEG